MVMVHSLGNASSFLSIYVFVSLWLSFSLVSRVFFFCSLCFLSSSLYFCFFGPYFSLFFVFGWSNQQPIERESWISLVEALKESPKMPLVSSSLFVSSFVLFLFSSLFSSFFSGLSSGFYKTITLVVAQYFSSLLEKG